MLVLGLEGGRSERSSWSVVAKLGFSSRWTQWAPHCTQLQCSEEITVEFYVPLCCDLCERRAKANLINSPGVESVTADQWEKKVVVVRRNLLPDDLLRRLQRQRDMSRSTLWEHRPQ